MSDEQLVKFGKAAAYMCSPKANLGHAPRKEFVIQLDEARAEWRRRHPEDREPQGLLKGNRLGNRFLARDAPNYSTASRNAQ